jgi:pimeloyl-ACP methyl ester carboxylesterase
MRGAAACLAATLLMLSACTSVDPPRKGFEPTFRTATCPADVEVQFLDPHECGYLTVLEDRDEPNGRRIELFVLRVDPIGVDPSPDPVLVAGWDVGDVTPYGAAQGLATNVHRVVYFLDERGVGHSRPSLACPEVPQATSGLATSDPSFPETFTEAVGACRDRLTGAGIDLGSYSLEESAADIEDLRRTLGIPTWNVGSYGTDSRIVLELLRTAPDHIRAVYLDAAQFPQLTDPDTAATGTAKAIEQVLRGCSHEAACRRSFPHLAADWSAALEAFGAEPVRVSIAGPGAPVALPISVEVDARTLVRAIRAELVTMEAGRIAAIPYTIHAAARGHLTNELALVIGNDQTLCAGYRPNCAVADTSSLGEYLSVLCRDEAPFVDRTSTSTPMAGSIAIDAAFATNPYLQACSVWNVPPAEAISDAPVRIHVPALVLSGQFDPFSPPSLTRGFAASLPAFFLDVPGQAGSVIAHAGCPNEIRNAWLDTPAAPPADTSCLDEMHLHFTTEDQPLAAP